MLLLALLVHAHPGGRDAQGRPTDFLGHRMELRVGEGRLELDYVAEVPLRLVTAEAEGADRTYARRRAAELADGLRVHWNGEPLRTEAVEVAQPGKLGDQGFIEFEVRRVATLPASTGTLTVSNGNYPDREGFYATRVEVGADLVVTESSLARAQDGRVRDNTHGAWTRKEEAREVRVALAPAGFWERRAGPGVLPERLRGLERLRAPGWTWAVGVAGVVLVAGLAGWRLRPAIVRA